ncbi:MAG TPA: hypothetical protein VLZ83_05080 [Edaphocola sp.]|nr:hypothetical protein [Edaphocola sp.]
MVFAILFGFIYALLGIAVIVALIYLIFKRIEDKKKEDFEDREY